MDKLSPERRSENMRRIRSNDTGIEMTVRKFVHSQGYRFRLHVRKLPGKPDLVFRRLGKIIQVYGCYWHPHSRCPISHVPKSREEYWGPKLKRNAERDAANVKALRKLSWRVLIIRECKMRTGKWQDRVVSFLAS
jgi:DNA mismatch endonuclease (patch repair protein)